MRKAALWFGIAALLIVADYASKWLVLARIAPGERIEVTGFFNLVLVFNKGAAFSFLSTASGWQTPLFLAIAVAAAVLISVLLVRPTPSPVYRAALALILGGALGNAVDRLRFGQVVDFLDFHYLGWHWPAFNVADAAITVGALLLVAESFMHRDKGGSVHG
ncbi:MAG: signal peptidase II [Betaproteobacteria bacterium]|nr:signal peptidase II [Betaproteobacteria bacterium]